MNNIDEIVHAMRAALSAELDERARWRADEHNQHHEWVKSKIQNEQARAEFWRAMAAKSLPGLAWSALVALGAGLVKLVRYALEHISWH